MSWKKEGVLVFRLKILIFSLVSFLTAFLSLESAGASLPSTLYFGENKLITIENCQFTSSTLSSLSGKGRLTLTFLKKSLGELTFAGIEAESSGKIKNIGQPYSFSLNQYTIRSIKPVISGGEYLLQIPEGEIEILIPELKTTLTLSFKDLKLNDWGEVEVKSLSFSGKGEIKKVAGLSGFSLTINRVSGKIQEGMPALNIEAKLTIFEQEIPLTLSYPGLVINLGNWVYHFRESEITISNSTLDLSRSGGVMNQEVDASWQGIYIAQGSFKLNGTDFKVSDCYLDSQGFTGKIAGSAENKQFLGNINFKRLSLDIDIRHNRNIKNFIKIEGCSFPPLQSSLTLTGILDENGYNLSVETGDNPIVKYDNLKLTASITRGQFFRSSDRYVLWLDGALSFDAKNLPSGIIQFHNLGIDTEGKFIFPETGLQVDSPSPLDFGDLFKCEVSSVQFLRDSNNKLKIQFDGALSLGADIPLNGKISFQELTLKEGPTVTLSGVSADFSLKGVARISGNLDKKEENGKECLSGGAKFYLFGASNPLGTSFDFKIYSYRSWAVAGVVSLGVPLNIPNTNLFIYSFSGGVGRNVTKKSNNAAFSIQNINTSPEANNWLFTGGIELGTAPPQLLDCNPLQLTVGFPQLSFSLYGKCTILKGPTITSTIEFNPLVPRFKFTSQTRFDLYNVIAVNGGMEVFAGKENGKPAVYLAIGWPYPENAVGFSMLNGKLYGRYGLYGYASSNTVEVRANAGAGLNVKIFKGEIEGELNFIINGDPFLSGQVMAEGEIDVWVGAVGASGELEVKLYKEPLLHYDGEVSAWVKIFGERMEISKDVSGKI